MTIANFNNEERKKICNKMIDEVIPFNIPPKFLDKKFELISFLSVFNNENLEIDVEQNWEDILTDGPGDCGIDGIAIILNGACINSIEDLNEFKRNVKDNWNINLYVFQSKFNTKWPTKILNTFNTLLPSFLTCDKKLKFNNDVQLKQNIWESVLNGKPNNSSVSLHINICNIGDLNDAIKDQQWNNSKFQLEETLKKILSFEKNVYINERDFEFLKINFNKKIFEKKISFVSELHDSFSDDDTINGHVILANLKEYYEFITNEKNEIIESIFSQNVRDFQKKTEINKNILDSLEKEKELDFWWLNNGITILVDSCKIFRSSLQLKNPQIINGLQTSYSMHEYFSKSQKIVENDKRKILIKIILASNQKNSSKIIASSNTQNSMNWATLRANEKVLRSLEHDFKLHNIYFERRKKFYSNKGKKSSEILIPDYAAKYYVSAFEKNPAIAKNRTIIYFREKENFDRIFSDENKKKIVNISLLSRDIIQKIDKLTFDSNYFSENDIDDIKIHFKYHLISIYFEALKNKEELFAEETQLSTSFKKLLELINNYRKEEKPESILKSISTDKGFQYYMYNGLK